MNEEQIEIVLDDVWHSYGYDFTGYTKASITRRIERLFILDRFPSFAEFRFKVKSDENYFKRFVEEITVNVTEMFRDPTFYKTLRSEVLPELAPKPFIRIWHAGCSSGEEVYSMAILLDECNLLNKSIIYATDINQDIISKAQSGIFNLSSMKYYSENYINSGGKKDFSSYYTAKYDRAIFRKHLSEKVVYSPHNLVSDSSFNEFQLILCRNVLIYFDKQLQDRVLTLFDNSLETLGFLALGSKETLKFSHIISKYQKNEKEKIWRKVK